MLEIRLERKAWQDTAVEKETSEKRSKGSARSQRYGT